MEPSSLGPLILLLLGTAGAIAAVLAFKAWIIRAVACIMAAVLGAAIGLWGVNAHYGYYRTWSALALDAVGSNPALQTALADSHADRGRGAAGRLVSVNIAGWRSHIRRSGLVYLPPQYDSRAYRNVRFPVVELLHGSPGQPNDWVTAMNVITAANELISRHLMGPLILVMPRTYTGHYEDCVNGVWAADETYLNDDVPNFIRTHFRASDSAAQWGLAGYSSGGYCAMNLALRHLGSYGAVAAMDGYFRAIDGPAADALGNNPDAERANSPLTIAQSLPAGRGPLPAIWLSAGTGTRADQVQAQAFVSALRGVEQITYVSEPGAEHNFYTWTAALPSVLAWMWTQLAPPELKLHFPLVGAATQVVIRPALPPRRGHSPRSVVVSAKSSPRPVATVTATVTATPTPKSSAAPRSQPTATITKTVTVTATPSRSPTQTSSRTAAPSLTHAPLAPVQ